MSLYHICYQKQGKLKFISLELELGNEFEQAVKKGEILENEGKIPKKQWCLLKGNNLAYASDVDYYKNNLALLLTDSCLS